MKSGKKSLAVLAMAAIMILSMVGCGNKVSDSEASTNSGENSSTVNIADGNVSDNKIKIVTTIFPEYDWVREILGDEINRADLIMLLDNGVDLHSYQPTAEDIMKISDCDLFVYVGGESDSWVDNALKEAVNKDMKVINLLEVLGDSVKEEEVVEGMQAEEEEEESEEEEPEYDEHVWLSLRNAQVLCNAIADALEEIAPDHADSYQKNVEAYNNRLSTLDEAYQSVVDKATRKTLLFGDRFPFRYLVDDYGLSYYAAFVGCSAETEASFETITFLAQKVDELHLSYVMTIEKSDQKIANTIIENTKEKNQQILTLDSMQSTTSEDVAKGTTYVSVMEENLNILMEALQ